MVSSGKRFLVLPDYAFMSDAPTGVWVAHGLAGTGGPRIGALERKLSPYGIALVALEPEITASNRVMGRELVDVGSASVGDQIALLSEFRGETREARVASTRTVGKSTRLTTYEYISRPGDGGAPVVNSSGALVAMGYAGYAGSPDGGWSEFIALQSVFQELGLTLAD